jgi:hypothetical protein
MKKLLLILLLCPSFVFGAPSGEDSLMSTQTVAERSYNLLNLKTTGVASLDTNIIYFFVREAALRACNDIGVPKGKMINITEGTTSYLVDDALIWIKGVVLDTNEVFKSMRPVELDRLTDNTYYRSLKGKTIRPDYYIRHGDSISIYPPPAASDSIYVFYFVRLAYPSNTTSLYNVPQEYRLAIIYGTCQMSLMRLRDYQGAEYYKGLYYEEVARLRTRFEFEVERKQ